MRPTPPPSPGLDPEVGLPVVPQVPLPLTDGGGDRLVVTTPAAAVTRPSAVLLAARQLLEEADPHARRRTGSDRARALRRRQDLRGLVVERRAQRDAVRPCA
ncbi:hypothetical protein F1C76_00370 [Geodermatophilaceae bacterium NBWT11]|nr:hypothetical protein F1C76_00370 [Geodermatophilaceae bacterium NBWT11]